MIDSMTRTAARGLLTRRKLLAASSASLLLGTLGTACATTPTGLLAQAPTADRKLGDATYEPRRGQSGKDVIWIPSPDKLVSRMLQLAGLSADDYLIDLGSGDGKIVLAAAQAGARGLGIEYNADMVGLAQRRAEEAGLSDRARFEKADLFDSDFSQASVITMYLLPHLNMKLRHRLMALKPGTRLVSHEFRLGHWEPDESSRIGGASAHLWLVPANAGGDWQLTFPQRAGPVTTRARIDQTFQNFKGRVVFDDFETEFREPKIAGDRVRFALTDADGALRRFEGRIQGDEIQGTVTRGDDGAGDARFSARRTGPAPAIGGSGPADESEGYMPGYASS